MADPQSQLVKWINSRLPALVGFDDTVELSQYLATFSTLPEVLEFLEPFAGKSKTVRRFANEYVDRKRASAVCIMLAGVLRPGWSVELGALACVCVWARLLHSGVTCSFPISPLPFQSLTADLKPYVKQGAQGAGGAGDYDSVATGSKGKKGKKRGGRRNKKDATPLPAPNAWGASSAATSAAAAAPPSLPSNATLGKRQTGADAWGAPMGKGKGKGKGKGGKGKGNKSQSGGGASDAGRLDGQRGRQAVAQQQAAPRRESSAVVGGVNRLPPRVAKLVAKAQAKKGPAQGTLCNCQATVHGLVRACGHAGMRACWCAMMRSPVRACRYGWWRVAASWVVFRPHQLLVVPGHVRDVERSSRTA